VRTMHRINCGQNCVNYSLSSANEFGEILVPSTLDKFVLFYSILFYSILFYFILFYSILFYTILFYTILFYSIFQHGSW
jgi:hypothetical protein